MTSPPAPSLLSAPSRKKPRKIAMAGGGESEREKEGGREEGREGGEGAGKRNGGEREITCATPASGDVMQT